ncbi:unnamed protein product, partial [Rotaria sp. Silwood2]
DNIASLNFIHYDKLLISIEKQQNEQIHINNQENSIYATAMISLEKEEMNFLIQFNVMEKLKYSNRLLMKEAIFYYRFKQNRLEWMRKYIGMVILAANQLWST